MIALTCLCALHENHNNVCTARSAKLLRAVYQMERRGAFVVLDVNIEALGSLQPQGQLKRERSRGEHNAQAAYRWGCEMAHNGHVSTVHGQVQRRASVVTLDGRKQRNKACVGKGGSGKCVPSCLSLRGSEAGPRLGIIQRKEWNTALVTTPRG